MQKLTKMERKPEVVLEIGAVFLVTSYEIASIEFRESRCLEIWCVVYGFG